MFQKYENVEFISNSFFNKKFFSHFGIDNRAFWNSISSGIECRLEGLDKDFTSFAPLTASQYMRFERDGDRACYQSEYFKRRKALVFYTFKEAIENEGCHLDKIVDLIWMILEESEWAVPAHACLSPGSDALPAFDEYALDLFAAETGAMLGFVYSVLKNRLDCVSRNITPRIIKALRERITDNYLARSNYGWMGFNGNKVNNWNPWINSNVLSILPIVCSKEEACTLVLKIMKSLDCYVDAYPEDGACDEGPSYWFMAGMSLLECLYSLYLYSDKSVNLFSEKKLVNIFHFFMKTYIGNDRVVNFADAPSRFICNYGTLYKLSVLLNDKEMVAFCKNMYDEFADSIPLDLTKPFRTLDLSSANNELKNMSKKSFPLLKSNYFESIQVMTRRMDSGLYLAAKGGHNDESHNHNDIGSFILFKDNLPFIIDSGNLMYTKDTFSNKRYNIWTNSSEYHNLPTIDEKNQLNGIKYHADNVVYKENMFSLDIKNAYENKDQIKKWNRRFDLSETEVSITEDFEFESEMDVTLNFLTAVRPEPEQGVILFSNNSKTLTMKIDTNSFDICTDVIEITDTILKRSWDKEIYRMRLKLKNKAICSKLRYSFQ